MDARTNDGFVIAMEERACDEVTQSPDEALMKHLDECEDLDFSF